MNKVKKIVLILLIICVAFSTLSISSIAANETVKTYLNFSSSFLGSEQRWGYPHIGYRYRDSSCASSNAKFDINVRRYNTSESVFYTTIAKFTNNPGNMSADTWFGTMAQNVGSGSSYCYNNYYTISGNNGNKIHAKYVELFSRDYIS